MTQIKFSKQNFIHYFEKGKQKITEPILNTSHHAIFTTLHLSVSNFLSLWYRPHIGLRLRKFRGTRTNKVMKHRGVKTRTATLLNLLQESLYLTKNIKRGQQIADNLGTIPQHKEKPLNNLVRSKSVTSTTTFSQKPHYQKTRTEFWDETPLMGKIVTTSNFLNFKFLFFPWLSKVDFDSWPYRYVKTITT